MNYLTPGLKRGAFSAAEERLVLELQASHGNRYGFAPHSLATVTTTEPPSRARVLVIEPQVVADSGETAGKDRQPDQELLELLHEEEAAAAKQERCRFR